MKLIHITDTHLVAPGHTLYGLDPRARLDAAVADINRHHANAEVVVITGDLTHWGEPEAYAGFAESIGTLRCPVVTLVGNHDKRAACLASLKQAPRDPNGFVQGVLDTPAGRLIFLDTLDEASHAGQMCAARLDWLKTTLGSTPTDRSVVIFMHHPPFAVGIHAMDEIALKEREAFRAIVAPHANQIRHLFFGHVHRPISGSWQGIPFSTLRGTNHQVALDLDPAAPHLASHEPPAYAIALIEAGSVVVHTHDFLDQSRLFPFSKPGVDDRTYALGSFV
jgi:3',5'-cyclic-AMP phosphodiesterase